MNTITVDVSPSIAKEWLEQNNNNRNLRAHFVTTLAKEMTEGKWHQTHQGIAFYEDGSLADGQHRLTAIVQSNTTQKFNVTFGLPKTSGIAIDTGSGREMHDVLRISGAPAWIDKNMVAVIRSCLSSLGKNMQKSSPYQVEDYGVRHERFLREAVRCTGPVKKRLTTSLLTSNYFCALNYGVGVSVIEQFSNVVRNGVANHDYETSAIRLREFLLTSYRGTGVDRFDISKKIQKAVFLFNKRTPISRLGLPDKLIFPVPE